MKPISRSANILDRSTKAISISPRYWIENRSYLGLLSNPCFCPIRTFFLPIRTSLEYVTEWRDVKEPFVVGLLHFQRRRPELRVIVTSGYIARGDVPSGTNFLHKPFSASDLLKRVRQVAA